MQSVRVVVVSILLVSWLVLLGPAPGLPAPPDPARVPAPTVLPSTSREMRTAGFWISRHGDPDRLVMDARAIEAFNLDTRKRAGLPRDVTGSDSVDGEAWKKEMRGTVDRLRRAGLFLSDGSRAPASLFGRVERNMDLGRLPATWAPRFGLVLRYADQRFLPTRQVLTVQRGDVDFGELQNSALDVGTPVVLVHQSRDGDWVYVLGPCSSGWVESRRVAEATREEVTAWQASPRWAVVTAAKTDLYLDATMRQHVGFVQMGARLPLAERASVPLKGIGAGTAIRVPVRGPGGRALVVDGWVAGEDIHEGPLPYTPRNVYRQAFRLLDHPYGWGGMDGEQDCSRFVQMVFATMGIDLPRDSKDQAKCGRSVASFDPATPVEARLEALSRTPPGVSLLTMRGHIMLFLGMLNGRPFVIHAVNKYAEAGPGREQFRVIHRVAVSDLAMGDGKYRQRWLKMLRGVLSVTP